MQRKFKKITTLLAVLSLLMLPASLNVEAAATVNIGNYPQTGRFYMFQNVHSGKFLEIADGNVTSGANVWQDTFNYDTNRSQVFRLLKPETEDIGGGNVNTSAYHQIKSSINATLRLDVVNAADQDGTNIGLFQYNPGYGAQSFRFIDNGDGSVRIEPYLSRNSGRVLTVVNASTASKANVVLSSWTGDTSQKWVVKEFYLEQDPQLINLNWSYFFRGDDSLPYRRLSRRMIEVSSTKLSHAGIDIIADAQVPIYSPCSGTVVELGVDGDGVADSMGNYVIIKSTATITVGGKQRNLTIRIMHMYDPPELSLHDTVTKNTVLGAVGSSGESSGNHLHVDINILGTTSGEDIRENPQYAINPEKLYLSKRFKYGSPESSAVYATNYVFYPDWSKVQ